MDPISRTVQVELSCPYEQFYNFFKTQASLLPKSYVAGTIVYCTELYGPTKSWTVANGSQKTLVFLNGQGVYESFVDQVEDVNDARLSITYSVVKGDIMSYFHTLKFQFIKVDNVNTVKWIVTYQLAGGQDPIQLYLDLLKRISELVDSYLRG